MKKIILEKFQAFTGKLFENEEDCLSYEAFIKKIENIMFFLEKIPDDIEFSNGGGYIQQDKEKVTKAREKILEIGRERYKSPDLSFGWMGRYCDDSGDRELYYAWGRLSHIDNKFREWGQGYYAINPDKGIQKPFISNEK